MPSRSDQNRYHDNRPSLRALTVAVIATHPRQSVATVMSAAAAFIIISNALFLQPGQHPAPIFAPKAKTGLPPVESVTLPRPRVVETAPVNQELIQPTPSAQPAQPMQPRGRADIVTDIQRELARKGFYDGPVDGIWGARTDGALRDFAQVAGLKTQLEASEEIVRALSRSAVTKGSRPASDAVPVAGSRHDPITEFLTPPRDIPNVPAPAVAPAGSKRLVAIQRALTDFGYGQIRPTGTMGPETQAAIERFERDRKLPVTGQLSDRLVRELGTVTGRPIE